LNDDLRKVISAYKTKHPAWSAKKILDTIRFDYFTVLKKSHPDWNDSKIEDNIKGKISFGVNSVQRYLRKEFKPNSEKIPRCLYEVWNLAIAEKYIEKNKVTPEALFHISAVQGYCERVRKNPDPPFGEYPPITVWQSLWIARLYTFIPYFQEQWEHDKKIHKNDLKVWCLISLYRWSRAYMHYEEICKLAGTPFNTTELDIRLRQGAIPTIVSGVQINGETINSLGAIVFIEPGNRVSMIPPYKEKDGEK
jgi:hypothetical protein